MAEKRNEYTYMAEWLATMGHRPDGRMAQLINSWWGWFTSENGFYSYKERRMFRTYKVERLTLHPFRFAAEAWSDLLMPELRISSPDEAMQREVLERCFRGFGLDRADFVARAFALGTGALALDFRGVSDDGMATPDAEVRIADYDASQVLPLTWSDDDCDQAAFASRVEYEGRDYDQCQAHVLVGGTYHIITQLFDLKNHKPVDVEGIVHDFDTRSPWPTFAFVRPAVANVHFDHCAMGASVCEKGIDAVKMVDEAFTSMHKHIRVGGPKVFIDDTMIEKSKKKTPSGETVTTYSAFGQADDVVFRMRPGNEGGKQMEVVQPDLKVSENAEAINDALKLLSITCGFGNGYFSWDAHNGLRTATEVKFDNSALALSLKRHQNALETSLARIIRGTAGALRGVCGIGVDPEAELSIDFDDSVVTDTQGEKNMAMAEIGALGVPELKVRYLMRWHAMSEDEARAAVASEDASAWEGM